MFRKISPLLLLLLAFALLLFTGCPNGGHRYEMGHFPMDPVNLEELNSEFDDYNSTSPVIESYRFLYFSSNRNSSGGNFDIVGSNLRIYFDKDDGDLTVDDRPIDWKNYAYTDSLFLMINTPSDEFGPYSFPYQEYYVNEYRYTDLVVYSNDVSGNQDLKFVAFRGWGENPYPDDGTYYNSQDISFLNTESNDAYATFYGPGFVMTDYFYWYYNAITEMIFCSDRNGNFDIFKTTVSAETDLLDFLGSESEKPIIAVDDLNSTADDKCPFVNGDMLVFTSNRPGGYGGYDLYYAKRMGDTWSEPINFGSRINTEYDEYRPIIITNYEFSNDMMIFSSNRPGGKGGYDLYYVGISRMTYYYLD